MDQLLDIDGYRHIGALGAPHETLVDFIVHGGSYVFARKGHRSASLYEVVRDAETLGNKGPPRQKLGDALGLQGFKAVVKRLNVDDARVIDIAARELSKPFKLDLAARCFRYFAVREAGIDSTV